MPDVSMVEKTPGSVAKRNSTRNLHPRADRRFVNETLPKIKTGRIAIPGRGSDFQETKCDCGPVRTVSVCRAWRRSRENETCNVACVDDVVPDGVVQWKSNAGAGSGGSLL